MNGHLSTTTLNHELTKECYRSWLYCRFDSAIHHWLHLGGVHKRQRHINRRKSASLLTIANWCSLFLSDSDRLSTGRWHIRLANMCSNMCERCLCLIHGRWFILNVFDLQHFLCFVQRIRDAVWNKLWWCIVMWRCSVVVWCRFK